jgi:hypothetical protein
MFSKDPGDLKMHDLPPSPAVVHVYVFAAEDGHSHGIIRAIESAVWDVPG